MAKKKRDNTKELIILETALVYLTLFLEQAGVLENDKVKKEIAGKFNDIDGAVKIGKELMFILSRVKVERQQKALDIAKIIMKNTDSTTEFNFLVFSLTILMEYKEKFIGKVYRLPTSYETLNDVFDEYFDLVLKDQDQMEVIKDSAKIASKFYENVIKYEG